MRNSNAAFKRREQALRLTSKALGPFYEYLVALGGTQYTDWCSDTNYHDSEELQKRSTNSPVKWRMFCYWLSLERTPKDNNGRPAYDKALPERAVERWYMSKEKERALFLTCRGESCSSLLILTLTSRPQKPSYLSIYTRKIGPSLLPSATNGAPTTFQIGD